MTPWSNLNYLGKINRVCIYTNVFHAFLFAWLGSLPLAMIHFFIGFFCFISDRLTDFFHKK